jgi:hypothetical protein
MPGRGVVDLIEEIKGRVENCRAIQLEAEVLLSEKMDEKSFHKKAGGKKISIEASQQDDIHRYFRSILSLL